jgi:hypothetical protein
MTYRHQRVFPPHIALAPNSFARPPLPETGNISLPLISLFLSLLRTTHIRNSKEEKKSSNLKNDDCAVSCSATCVLDNIIISGTFTKLCTTMYTESTRLSKDTRFITSCSKALVAQSRNSQRFMVHDSLLPFHKSKPPAMCSISVYAGFSCKELLISHPSPRL